jgi:hypothetical protein
MPSVGFDGAARPEECTDEIALADGLAERAKGE